MKLVIRQSAFVMMISLSMGLASSCVSFDGKESAPKITDEMPLKEKLAHAVDFGGETFKSVSKSISEKKQWRQTEKILASFIIKNASNWQDSQILNATKLYGKTGVQNVDLVFIKLVELNKPIATEAAWKLMRLAEPKKANGVIDSVLTEAVVNSDIDRHLIPEMAAAVEILDTKSVYGVLKLGLMKTGDAQFVSAMTKLYPVKASDDLFDYLVIPSDDELRQRALKSIDTITAVQILEFLERNPMSFGHKELGKIFVYSASRNIGLRQLARNVIDRIAAGNVEILAFELTKQPKWVQMSLIESARRSMTANTKVLLKKLQEMTPDRNVEEEISLLRM